MEYAVFLASMYFHCRNFFESISNVHLFLSHSLVAFRRSFDHYKVEAIYAHPERFYETTNQRGGVDALLDGETDGG